IHHNSSCCLSLSQGPFTGHAPGARSRTHGSLLCPLVFCYHKNMDMMRGFCLLLLGAVLIAGVPAARAEEGKKPQTGFALVGVVDGAEVYVDGDKIGTTPLPPVSAVPSGEHTIRVV